MEIQDISSYTIQKLGVLQYVISQIQEMQKNGYSREDIIFAFRHAADLLDDKPKKVYRSLPDGAGTNF